MRLAVIEYDICNPKKCGLECLKFCPGVRMGEETVVLAEGGKPRISPVLCLGCGICVRKCPLEAVHIVNLPDELREDLVHSYGKNGFKLFRLPVVKRGAVVGVVGRNGTGKSTALKILSGKLVPSLKMEGESSKDDVVNHFRGTALYEYFRDLYAGALKVSYKPQEVYALPRVVKGVVGELLGRVDERGALRDVARALSLDGAMEKELGELSGGELQRVAVAAAALKDADVYLFDEPSSFNDVYQRVAVAKLIRSLAELGKVVVVVEHDLALLDYVADVVHVVYGEPGAYGIVGHAEAVGPGINVFLDGYAPRDNVRFRDRPITFSRSPAPPSAAMEVPYLSYGRMVKVLGEFRLEVEPGSIHEGEVVGVVGANALGKTTFARLIVGELEPDEGKIAVQPGEISYKPQYVSLDFEGRVEDFLRETVGSSALSEQAKDVVLGPLGLVRLLDRLVADLSGGEAQKLAVAACLLKEADLYVLDEPSAFVDVEDRLTIASLIKRVSTLSKKPCLVIDHDLLFIDHVSSRVILFEGKPGAEGRASAPLSKTEALNALLKGLDMTFRRDARTGRPRVNKPGSRLDREQRAAGKYFYE